MSAFNGLKVGISSVEQGNNVVLILLKRRHVPTIIQAVLNGFVVNMKVIPLCLKSVKISQCLLSSFHFFIQFLNCL